MTKSDLILQSILSDSDFWPFKQSDYFTAEYLTPHDYSTNEPYTMQIQPKSSDIIFF